MAIANRIRLPVCGERVIRTQRLARASGGEEGESAAAPRRLALRELEAATGFGFAVFLALDDTAVPGEEPLALQQGAQARLVAGQGLADAVAHGAGLARQAAPFYRAPYIELA